MAVLYSFLHCTVFQTGNVSDIFETTPVIVTKESRTRAENPELNLKEILREVQSLGKKQ